MAENRLLSRIFGKEGNEGIKRGTWMVFLSLILIFVLALFLRTYFGFEDATRYGAPFLVSGGSDSYYHERAIYTAAYEHHSLIKDTMLNYPLGSRNPRPPAYDWSVVLGGYLLSPLVGDLGAAISYSLIFSTAIWGALTVFPVYFIGKKVFNRKVGIIAAFLIATLPAHMQRSPLTDADHDAFVLFFAIVSIYFLLAALENLKEREWVERWRDIRDVKKGIKEMFTENRKAFLYTFLSAISTLTVALTWTGFPYLYAIFVFYFLIQIFILAFRKIDPTTITFVAIILLLLPIALALPLYLAVSIFQWLLTPFIMAAVVIGIGLYFSFGKKLPWTLTIPILIVGIISLLVVHLMFFPSTMARIASQTGYFTANKVYRTIAEAQAPYFSNLVLSFGIATFFLALLGVGWIIWKIRKNWNPYFVFFVLWSAESIYMALSAARFMFNAAPAFAIASAWVVYYIIKKANFASVKNTYRSLRGNKLYAIKKSIGIKHILVALFLVFLVILPNVWYAVDAGIPSNDKKKYDSEVYNAMPDFLRPDPSVFNDSSRGTWYFGAFGYSLPTPDQYWPAAWTWFAKQDSDKLPEDRPAFLSWWDYGFECIQQGRHPTVADNFQAGYQIAGNFIMAQNETDAVSLLIERILDSEYNGHTKQFTERSVDLMEKYLSDRDAEKISEIYRNPNSYIPEILAHPEKYGPYEDIRTVNAKYIATRGVLMKYNLEHLVSFLHTLEDMTGKRIGYFAIDSRLIPFSARNTGIFYAPAVLSDHRISSGAYRLPYDFYQLYAVTKYGKKYPINEVPADAKASINNTEIKYEDMFYNSMLYRNYFGYSPKEVGSNANGLPGLSRDLQKMKPMPGWNLTHFRLVYRTVYWNPYKDYKNHSGEWRAIGLDEGMKYQKEGKGIVDMSANTAYNGVTFLEYYEGAIINGTVKTPEGIPAGGIRVTIYDKYGIPHQSVLTDSKGRYSLIAPFGNVTIVASSGGSLDRTRLLEKNLLNATHLKVRKDQAFREKVDIDGDGKWDYLIEKDLVVSTSSIKGTVFLDMNNDKTKQDVESGISAKVTLYGKSIKINYTTVANESGAYNFSGVVPGDYGIMASVGAYTKDANITVTVEPNKEKQQDVAISTGKLTGKAVLDSREPFAGESMWIVNIQDSTKRHFVTDNSGKFFIDGVIPGVYYFILENTSYAASSFRIGVSANQSSDVNLTIYPAHKVEGYANMNYKGVPFATVNFVNYTFPSMSRTVTCDKDGYYSAILPDGEYTVTSTYIQNRKTYMVMEKLQINENSTVSFEMSRAYKISGYIRYYIPDKHEFSYKDKFPVTFIGKDGSRIDYYSVSGNYTAYLPSGRYHVYVDYSFALFPYAYSGEIEVNNAPVALDIDLVKGITVKGYMRGVAGIPLKSASVVFISEDGERFSTISDDKGLYTFNLVPGNYTMKVSAEWYKQKTMDIVASDENNPMDMDISLSAEEVALYGTVSSTEGPVSGINISFVGYNSTFNATSDAGGNYSITLPAGRYALDVRQNIDENGTEVYELKNKESISVSPEQSPFKKDISIEKRFRVVGGVFLAGEPANSTIWISRDSASISYELTNGSFEVYLPQGVYTVNSTANNNSYAIFRKMAVDSPENVTINFSRAYYVNINLMSEGKTKTGIPVKIISSEGAEKIFNPEGNVVSTYLPSGEYSLDVNYTVEEEIGGIVRNVTYSADDTVTVNGNTSHILGLSRYVPEGSLSAAVLADKTPVEGTNIWLKSTEGGKEYNVSTNSQGEFSIDVPMGTYVIYADTSLGDNPYVIMDKVFVREKSTETLNMSQAVVFSGRALSEDGNGIRANITVINSEDQRIQKTFETDEYGNFEIALPKGMYSLVANAKLMEYSVESSFIYQGDIQLNFSMQKNLILEKMKIHRPTLSWDSSEKETASPGDTIVYHITVRNSGNCMDTYNLTGTPWNLEFEPSTLSLNPGEERNVAVKINLPGDAKVNHEPVKILAKVAGAPESTGEVIVDVNVRDVYGASAESISESSWVDGNAIYGFSIRNTGNIEDTFTVLIGNEEELNSEGWKSEISSEKTGSYSDFVSNLKIEANSTQTVYVKLIPIALRPSYSPDITLLIHSQNTSSKHSFTLPLPSIEIKSDVSIEGGAQIWVEKPLDMSPVYWALGLIVAVAVGYWLLKKKRVIM